MKKTAIVLSVVFLVLGFVGIWVQAYLGSAMCFIISLGWVGLKGQIPSPDQITK